MYRGMDINPNNIVMTSSLRADDEEYVHPQGRTRIVRKMFDRAPDGKWLEKDRGPLGFRTPNGLVWGHAPDEFGYICRSPGFSVATVYSRSQIKELGELYNDDEFEGPLVRPRVRRPWPVLKLPKKHPANMDPPLGAIDEGCEEGHEDPEYRTYTMRWDEFSSDKSTAAQVATSDGASTSQSAPPPARGCSADPAQVCRGRLEPNDASPPLVNHYRHAYHYLWCNHFVERLKAQKRPTDLITRTVHQMNRHGIMADNNGILVFDTPEAMLPYMLEMNWEPVPGMHVPDDPETTARYAAPLEMVLPDVDDNVDAETNAGDDPQLPCDVCKDEMAAESDHQQPDEDVDMDDPQTKVNAEPTMKALPASGLFSVQDIPKLEEFIPEGLFPDVLLVHDPQQLTNHKQTSDDPVKYRRIYPVLPRDSDEDKPSAKKEELVAHLYLHPANQFGSGHHSFVYRAPLTLPPPLSARSRTGQCTVAAKLAYRRCTAHRLLRHEADVYNAFPKDTQEEYCGFNVVPPCHRYPVPVGAIVPKFFGFYVAEGESSRPHSEHAICSEDGPCRVDWMSPILLMEECGQPVEPEKFTADQRTECFSLLLRLHNLLIRQGSFYVRNVMIQPGPLTLSPERRSFAHPSFRLIDFGRGECFDRTPKGPNDEEWVKLRNNFQVRVFDELRCAREQLLIEQVVGF